MAKFNIKSFLSNNRELVILNFEKLQKEECYNGVTLKSFMIAVMRNLELNAKSEKTAIKKLPYVIDAVYNENIEIGVSFSKPYSQSNHAKQVNYYGIEKVNQFKNI